MLMRTSGLPILRFFKNGVVFSAAVPRCFISTATAWYSRGISRLSTAFTDDSMCAPHAYVAA